jgi:hypothetical protein
MSIEKTIKMSIENKCKVVADWYVDTSDTEALINEITFCYKALYLLNNTEIVDYIDEEYKNIKEGA